jgi:hypothetical protein
VGIIESIKNLFRDPLLEEVVAAYGWERDLSSPLRVWRGHAGNRKVSLELNYDKKHWFLTAGDLGPNEDEEDSIYLQRMDALGVTEDPDPEESIHRLPGLAGTALARQYLIAGEPASGDYSVLQLPAVRDSLPRFSPAVEFADLYFNRKAVVLGLNRKKLTRADFDADLAIAIDLVKAQGG